MNGFALALPALLGSLLGAVATPVVVSAQDVKPPHLVEEAFIGDLAFTQDRGEIQIASLMRAAGNSLNRTARVPLEIEYGITDDIELSVETGGFNYSRDTGWSSPSGFGLGLRYGRYGLLPNLHASVTIEVESEREDATRVTSTRSGLQLGVDIPRLRMTHLFTSVVTGVWNSERTGKEVDWSAGVVVPFGRFRGMVERPLVVSDAANRGAVTGLVWKVVEGFDVGIATTVLTQPDVRARGAMMSFLLEF
jgi:hypothetical protein